MDDYITISVPTRIGDLLRNLTDLIKFYQTRESDLARICLKHMTQTELARELGVTKQAVNLRYSTKQKSGEVEQK